MSGIQSLLNSDEKVRVLIVDDSDDQRLLLRTYFERAGCRVEVASSGEEAMDSVGAFAPDLVVLDLILPGIDGWDLAERLFADTPGCPIAITSVLDAEDYPSAHTAMPKPVTGARVRQILRDIVPKWVEA